MLLDFRKMHGLGNDFIVFDAATDADIPSREVFQRLGHRRTGIGFDQALVLQPPRTADTDVYYRIFNTDGSEAEQCGNGARCIASLIAKRLHREQIRMDSPGGRVNARLNIDGTVAVDMGAPDFRPEALPFAAPREQDLYTLHIQDRNSIDRNIEIGAVSMGNPHAVLRVPSIATAPVDSLGPAVENHLSFAKRVNVGFMEVLARDQIRLRVFERGVGETLACGTGACAAVAVGNRLGWLDQKVKVDLPGGRAIVEWMGSGSPVWLTGPVATVFTGQVSI